MSGHAGPPALFLIGAGMVLLALGMCIGSELARSEQRARDCAEFGGVIVGDKCIRKDSLKPVEAK